MPPKKQKASLSSKIKGTATGTSPLYSFPSNFHDLYPNLLKQYFKPQPVTIVPDQIITIEKFFSNELCNELIKSFMNQLTLETTPLIKSRDYAARFNDRCSITDPVSAHELWYYLQSILLQESIQDDEDELNEIFEDAVGLNPQLRIYRYKKGHHFGKHYDESVNCPISNDVKQTGKTKWTLLIYLTGDDEFKGGDTIFHPDFRGAEPISIHPSKGMALLHKHGDDCLKHEAEIVKDGEKWVLRSDVTYLMNS